MELGSLNANGKSLLTEPQVQAPPQLQISEVKFASIIENTIEARSIFCV
ncbi:hypothetical protein [Leptolyngbya sp. NM3-A1]